MLESEKLVAILPIRYHNLLYTFSKSYPVNFKEKIQTSIFLIQEEVNENFIRSYG